VEGLEDSRALGGHGGAHEQECVDRKVGIACEGNAQVGHPALELEEAIGALGLAGLGGGRLVARCLEDPSEEHRAVRKLDAGARGERRKPGIREVAVGTTVIEEELETRHGASSSRAGLRRGAPAMIENQS